MWRVEGMTTGDATGAARGNPRTRGRASADAPLYLDVLPEPSRNGRLVSFTNCWMVTVWVPPLDVTASQYEKPLGLTDLIFLFPTVYCSLDSAGAVGPAN